jgi:F-type H+-transporting ATPase subunit delta
VTAEPVGASGLADRYAAALFDLADEAKNLDAVADDLNSLGAMIRNSKDLERLVRSPVIAREDQSRALAALMEKAGLGALTRKFVGLVARNRRLFVLPAMISAYRARLAARRGETTAEVVSARALSPHQVEALADSLKKALGTKVAVDTKVDPALLGGLVVKVGSRMVDSSLRTKLQQLRLAMKGVG